MDIKFFVREVLDRPLNTRGRQLDDWMTRVGIILAAGAILLNAYRFFIRLNDKNLAKPTRRVTDENNFRR